jgi:hypothetical protein
MKKMKRYKLKVLTGVGMYGHYEISILANGHSYSEAGCYYFYTLDEDRRRTDLAYYPIEKTIIESIEYDAK